jgi:large conductance mechanosensitive channel
MSVLKEFREFAMKGNVVDLAIGVIIGGAFGKIVTSMVEDIIMPLVGKLTGGISFADKFIAIDGKDYANLADAKKAGAALAYGNFLQLVFNFLIVAFCMFIVVKAMNKMKREQPAEPAAAPEPTAEEKLLTEIRDLLKSK